MATYTHLGHRRAIGHGRSSRWLNGNARYGGKVHALNGGPSLSIGTQYTSLCGEIVQVDDDDMDNYDPQKNVWTAGNGKVTCKRCLTIIG